MFFSGFSDRFKKIIKKELQILKTFSESKAMLVFVQSWWDHVFNWYMLFMTFIKTEYDFILFWWSCFDFAA